MGRLLYAVAATAAACLQAGAAHAWAAQPRAIVRGDLDPALKAEIVRAVGETDRPVDNRFEARRRANAAAEDAIAVLRSEGYYAYVVEPEVGEGDTPVPAIAVTPGPRFVLAQPVIDWVGPPPDAAVRQAAAAALSLTPGAPARAADVVSAEGRAIAIVQQHGYADAKAEPREVVVDHADHTLHATYRLAAGSPVRLDGIRLSGKGRTDTAWLQHLAPWRTGEAYQPKDVAELERRLLDTGVYDEVTVALAPAAQATSDGLRPVVVSLAERKRHTIEVGASYGTNEGPGADVRWTRYNFLGRADTLTLLARGSKIDSRLEGDLSLPHWRMPDQTLTLSSALYQSNTDAFDVAGLNLHADAQHHFTKTSWLTFGASIDYSRTREIKPGTLTPLGRDVLALGGLADLALDRSDDPLNPTHGWRVSARAEPTLLAGRGTTPYLKLQAQGSYYLPLDSQAQTVIAARLHAGAILDGDVADIPAPQRFYAGGGGSVRGFAFQAVGPRLPDNTPQGGLSLLEGSLELRRQLTHTWGLAAFVDVGDVGGSATPQFRDLGVGAGLGVRYNLGFAPIRVDVAVPVSGRRGGAPFQVYVSIGQSF